jgi:beta-lactamase regulating signal transducer with metallopeptidase domain/thiol-disulfide isomerase/thioredoxin/5-hydroxyisourate hydrolase-like protein (transthyretin family)
MTSESLALCEPALHTIGYCLLHFVWQGLLVGGGLALLMALLRKSAANTRYVVLFAGLMVMAALPLLTMTLLPPSPTAMSLAADAADPAPSDTGNAATPATSAVDVVAPALAAASAPPPAARTLGLAVWAARVRTLLDPWLPGVASLWLLGVCLLALWNLGGWMQVRRLRVRDVTETPQPWRENLEQICRRLGVSRPVRLLESGRVAVPMVVGTLRPVILLPVAVLTGLTPDQVHAVLAHEVAHIRRHDYAANLVQTAIVTLLFYHPAVWWVSRRIREERENCCDDLAVKSCGDSMLYARALAELAGQCSASAPMAMAATGGVLLRRVERVLGVPQPRVKGWTPLAAGLCMVLPLGSAMGIHPGGGPGGILLAAQSEFMGRAEDFVVDNFQKAVGFFTKKEKLMVDVGGFVVDEDGKPVPNVKVVVHYPSDMGMMRVAEAVTDAEGRWQSKIPKDIPSVTFRLEHPDFAPDTSGAWITVSEELLTGKFRGTIKRGVRLRGVVVDESGAPVKDAVVVRDFTNIDDIAKYREQIQKGEITNAVIADGEGRYDLPAAADKDCNLYVFSEVLAPQCLRLGKKREELRIVMTKGKTWSGTVRDAAGAPMEGVGVGGGHWTIEQGRAFTAMHIYKTKTDANGRFTITQLPEMGTVDFGAKKDKFFRRDIDWSAMEENETEFVLYPWAELQGRVLDAVTGKPVKYFTVDFDRSEKAEPIASYWVHNPVKYRASDGKFSVETGASTGKVPGAVRVRITSENYYTAFCDPVYATEFASNPPDIRMEPAEPLTGTVLLPDGKAAKDVAVALVEPDQVAYIEKARMNPDFVDAPYNCATTDKEGHFQLCPSKGPALIIALHETGWAIRPLAEHKDKGPLTLSAWSQLEGSLTAQERPKDEKVYVGAKVMLPKEWNAGTSVQFSLGATADEAGHFKIDHVPALPLRVGESRRWVKSHAVDVTPEPGKTMQVGFCADRNGAVRGTLNVDPAFADLGAETEEPWNSSRRLFITARRHGDDTKDENSGFVPIVLEDGTFTLDCLPPGDYDLTATLHDAPPKNACGRGTPAARAERAFTIAPDQSAPVALGDLAFAAIPRPEAGSAAPELQGTTLDGKAWKLGDEKGTPVLLVFWATWCAPCKAEIPVLKSLWKQYGESGKLRIVGLNLDREVKDAAKFVAREEMPWPQCHIGVWSETNPNTSAYGVSAIPSNWLVDASGNVVESKIAADALASVLERHLQ